jgi:hypothetical protein
MWLSSSNQRRDMVITEAPWVNPRLIFVLLVAHRDHQSTWRKIRGRDVRLKRMREFIDSWCAAATASLT